MLIKEFIYSKCLEKKKYSRTAKNEVFTRNNKLGTNNMKTRCFGYCRLNFSIQAKNHSEFNMYLGDLQYFVNAPKTSYISLLLTLARSPYAPIRQCLSHPFWVFNSNPLWSQGALFGFSPWPLYFFFPFFFQSALCGFSL